MTAQQTSSLQHDERYGLKLSRFNVEVPLKLERTLLFNSLTEQLVLLSSQEVDLLHGAPESFSTLGNKNEQFLKYLAAGGFVVHQNEREVEKVAQRYEARRVDPTNMTVTIATTLGCNLACGYCFQGQNKKTTRFEESARHALIAHLKRRAIDLDQLSIVWYGGEPLMNAAEIWAISEPVREVCREHNVAYSGSIVTNGYLLTPAIAARLIQNGVTSAQITLDGVEASHDRMRPHISGRGTFDKTINNVLNVVMDDDLSALNIALRISVDARNPGDIWQLLDELAARGFGGKPNVSIYFAPIEAISAGCSDYEHLSMSKREYAELEVSLIRRATALNLRHHNQFGQDQSLCQAVKPNDLVLTPTGDVHKCWDTVSFDRFSISNIKDTDFAERAASNPWTEWTASANDICSSCKILPICGGGCAFKTVHFGEQSGEAASLPCISLKFNLAERLFQVACAAGILEDADWDPELSPTAQGGDLKTGSSHYPGSLERSQFRFAPKDAVELATS